MIKSIGNIKEYKTTKTGLSFTTDTFYGNVHFIDEEICHVRINQTDTAPHEFSYAIDQDLKAKNIAVQEERKQVVLKSAKASVVIEHAPLRIKFLDKKGKLLNEDEAGFGVSAVGTEISCYKKLQVDEKFIGLGEKTGPMNKAGMAFTHWNSDKFGYSVEEDPIYLSTPFYIGMHEQGIYGVFLDNCHHTTVNFGASSRRCSWFAVDNGSLNYYLIAGDSIADIVKNYAKLTGKIQMPPKWSLGFQQCRYSYYPDHEVKQLAQTFRDKQIPADVIYFDIHYMDKYKAFTFDPENFSNPKGLMKQLNKQGFKVVCIVDPGIKSEKGYDAYESGVKADVYIKHPDDTYYEGEVWPGWSCFPDFTSEKGRNWWANELKFYQQNGVPGIWNDMNEPATWGQCLPSNINFDYEGLGATHKSARNVYGMQMARASFEGMKKHLKGKRPFILTRAGYSGIQRYAAVWTGDNISSDEHMMLSVRMLLSMGLAGVPYAGSDIGGFAEECTSALYARWISIGAFQPMFRAHSMVNTRDAEPWSFGEEAEKIARNYIGLRYKLMPYLYSAMYEAAQTGMPLMRPLVMDYSDRPEVLSSDFEHQHLFGHGILVIPALSTETYKKAFLPKGDWYYLYTDTKIRGNKTVPVECPLYELPLFVKAGAIIPMQSLVQNTSEQHDGTLRLHIYKGPNNSYELYEDDGDTYAHETGAYALRNISLEKNSLTIRKQKGKFDSSFQTLKIYFHGWDKVQQLKSNKKAIKTANENYRFIDTIASIETFAPDKGEHLKIENITTASLPFIKGKIEINWK